MVEDYLLWLLDSPDQARALRPRALGFGAPSSAGGSGKDCHQRGRSISQSVSSHQRRRRQL
jgi:hypothetical protein